MSLGFLVLYIHAHSQELRILLSFNFLASAFAANLFYLSEMCCAYLRSAGAILLSSKTNKHCNGASRKTTWQYEITSNPKFVGYALTAKTRAYSIHNATHALEITTDALLFGAKLQKESIIAHCLQTTMLDTNKKIAAPALKCF